MISQLLRITSYSDVRERDLMDIYAESNLDNTDYFYPDESNKLKAVRLVEVGFLDYLEHDFLKQDGATLWVWVVNGQWVSALRTSKIKDRLYYLEALETALEYRHKGYASELLFAVIDALKTDGPFRLCDCVNKNNLASLKTHQKCGFKIATDPGYDYLQEGSSDRDYGLEVTYITD